AGQPGTGVSAMPAVANPAWRRSSRREISVGRGALGMTGSMATSGEWKGAESRDRAVPGRNTPRGRSEPGDFPALDLDAITPPAFVRDQNRGFLIDRLDRPDENVLN